jgi:hypothetical protein
VADTLAALSEKGRAIVAAWDEAINLVMECEHLERPLHHPATLAMLTRRNFMAGIYGLDKRTPHA